MKNPEFANHIRNKQKIEWRVDSPNILQLTDDTFNSAIRSDEPVMVLFYAPCRCCLINISIKASGIFGFQGVNIVRN